MHAIPTSSATAAFAAPLPAAPTSDSTQPADSGSGDLLAAMRPAMDTAFAVGRPTDAAGAAAVLSTGGSYLQGASSTLARLDEGIARRQQQVERLQQVDPEAAKEQQGQLELLLKLRDRIQLSIERVGDILAGKDRDDIGTGQGEEPSRRELLEQLEHRRQLLAPTGADAVGAGASPALVAGTYAQASLGLS